ncbi:hypothetical protein ABFP36_23255, partial [Salmonella enterica subsp. enterica serovar Kentucky]|uniref:hypothetical protein n=1 Tax=Salmonella enterica TaxID=28901 RepID=UPI003F4C3249
GNLNKSGCNGKKYPPAVKLLLTVSNRFFIHSKTVAKCPILLSTVTLAVGRITAKNVTLLLPYPLRFYFALY